MKKITMGESIQYTSPHLFAGIVTKNQEGLVNVMGVSWFSFVSIREEKLLFCISKKGYTGKVIEETGTATLCVIPEKLKSLLWECSICSGNNLNKMEEFGFELTEEAGFSTPLLKGAGVSWSLNLEQKIDAGDHNIFLMQVNNIVLDQEENYIYAFDGYRNLKTLD